MVMSAVSSVSTPGVLVTVMPRATAAATSMLSTPLPKLAISLRFGPASLSTAASMRSVTVGTSTSAVFIASASWAWLIGLSSRLSRVSNSSRMRVSTLSGSLRVTTTRGFLDLGMPARVSRFVDSWPEISRPVQSSLTGLGDTGRRPIAVRVGARFLLYQMGVSRQRHPGSRPFTPNWFCCVAHETRQSCPVCDDFCGVRRRSAGARRPSRPVPPAGCRCRASSASRPTRSTCTSARPRPTKPSGSISAPACRWRSPPNSRTGAASAMPTAPRAGCTTRCCPAGAPAW